MSVAAVQPYDLPRPRGRGAGLLLAHCAGIAGGEERELPYVRLEGALGCELAHLLVYALSGTHGRRGASSP